MKLPHSLLVITSIFLLTLLSACSNTTTNKVNKPKPKTINTKMEVQTGTVLAVNKLVTQPKQYRPRANVGVSVGSGGHAGIYGAMDVLSIGRLLRGPEKPKVAYNIIVKRDNGEVVSVTQPATIHFNRGDKVKILQQNGEARVIH